MTRMRNWNRWTPAVRGASAGETPLPGSVANQLMESSQARRGLSPHDAAELALAAGAYLSVIR